jgi:predicted O-methyltransferase YrrM
MNKLKFTYFLVKNRLLHANKIFTHVTSEEKFVLFKLAKTSTVAALEVGSYLGASTNFIASGLKKSVPLYCVDTWENHSMTEGPRDTYQDFLKNTSKFKSRIHMVRGLSEQVAAGNSAKFDFAFFDGDHSYEGIKTDWDCWSPYLLKGCIVAFHDYGWAEGVKKVIQDDVMPNLKNHNQLDNLFWGEIK